METVETERLSIREHVQKLLHTIGAHDMVRDKGLWWDLWAKHGAAVRAKFQCVDTHVQLEVLAAILDAYATYRTTGVEEWERHSGGQGHKVRWYLELFLTLVHQVTSVPAEVRVIVPRWEDCRIHMTTRDLDSDAPQRVVCEHGKVDPDALQAYLMICKHCT